MVMLHRRRPASQTQPDQQTSAVPISMGSTGASTTATRIADVSIVIIVTLCYSTYALIRHAVFRSAGYDLGIFDQAVRNYAHFHLPYSPLKGVSFNLLGDHFHPLLMVFAPLYWIWDDPRMLLVGQAIVVALSLPLLTRIAERRMHPIAARIFTVLIAFSWPMQGLIDFNFHEICMAIPLVCLAYDALDRRSFTPFIVACVLLLGVREDLGTIVALLGLVWAWEVWRTTHDHRQALRGVYMFLGGIVAFVVITRLVIPSLAPDGTFAYWDYPDFGSSLSDMLAMIVQHPLKSLGIAFDNSYKRQTLLLLVEPFFFLCLGSVRWLPCLPILLSRMWSSRPLLWMGMFHYNAIEFVIFAIAAVTVVGKVSRNWRKAVAAVLLVSIAYSYRIAHLEGEWTEPFRQLPQDVRTIKNNPRIDAINEMLAAVPENTCVTADDRVAPHLTSTNRVTVPGAPTPRTDLVILDMTQADTGNGLSKPSDALKNYEDQGYQRIADKENYILLSTSNVVPDKRLCGPTAP